MLFYTLFVVCYEAVFNLGIDQDRGDILVHALSTDDVDAEIALIKQRYEQPLITIFSVEAGEKV